MGRNLELVTGIISPRLNFSGLAHQVLDLRAALFRHTTHLDALFWKQPLQVYTVNKH